MRILAAATDGAWLQRALADIDEILVDHAHCEKKAASTALSLLFRYPERAGLLVPLARLAQEELGHFAEVVEMLEARGVGLRHQVPSSYAGALMAAVRPTEPERLVDTLLCAALIEARSCERMQLLADALTDDRLVTLYRGLLQRALFCVLSDDDANRWALEAEAFLVPPGIVRRALRRGAAQPLVEVDLRARTGVRGPLAGHRHADPVGAGGRGREPARADDAGRARRDGGVQTR